MQLFDLLRLESPELAPDRCKLHLATPAGSSDPLDHFLAGRFDDWQSWQSKRNFGREFIVSLIKMRGRNRWLYAGAYRSSAPRTVEGGHTRWKYDPTLLADPNDLAGRLVVGFKRSGRGAYRKAETLADSLSVAELLPQRLRVSEFPGYTWVRLSRAHLELIVDQGIESWRHALGAVAGVYVITDLSNGALYVGSAVGRAGIWGRWATYRANGHGGNKDLRKLLREQGPDYVQHFQYAVLETADTRASEQDVLARESHWKRVLGSREHGYNAN